MIDTIMVRWRALLPGQRRWLFLNALLVTAVINLVINAVLARVSAGSETSIPLWALPRLGHPSVGIDTLGTFFFLPLATCLGCTRAVRLARRRGQLAPVARADLGAWCDRLPEGRVGRGVVLGAMCFAILTPVAIVAFAVDGVGDLSRTSFVVYKAILGVVLGAIVTPVIALVAMAEPSPRPLRAAT